MAPGEGTHDGVGDRLDNGAVGKGDAIAAPSLVKSMRKRCRPYQIIHTENIWP